MTKIEFCDHGHRLTKANLITGPHAKQRQCRTCQRYLGTGYMLMTSLGLKAREAPQLPDVMTHKRKMRRFVTRPPSAVDLAALAPVHVQRKRPHPTDENRLNDAIELRTKLYRQDALDALQDLALMPLSDNSSQNQIKFMAAQRLLGDKVETTPTPAGPPGTDVMQQLRDAYRTAAPRIREVRERIVTFDSDAPPGAGMPLA